MPLHHALHWTVNETSRFMRLWYLSTCDQQMLRRACTSAHSCLGHNCSRTHRRNVDECACLKLGGGCVQYTNEHRNNCLLSDKKKNVQKSVSFMTKFKLQGFFSPNSARNSTLLYANNKGADQPAHLRSPINYLLKV